MSSVCLNDVFLSFGDFNLLDGINFHISVKDKIGLVGRNGAGKSTILKLLAGLQEPTKGSVDCPKDLRIGYLPQVMNHNTGRTVLQEALTVFREKDELKAKLGEISVELSNRTDYDSASYMALIEKLNHINDRLALLNSDEAEARAERTLMGLGFKQEELGRNCETFSQGWNMRVELAKILLQEPDILLLDEPTNHLDIESIEWLESYLQAYRGAIILVSHDRKFLDNITNRTIELSLGKINDYKVPYSKYLILRAERLETQKAAFENQRKMIEKTEEFIEKFRYKATKSNQVQSRIKSLEKLDRIELDEVDTSKLKICFPQAPRSGDVVFKTRDLQASYPNKIVFSDANIEIKRGEKVALVGRNGEGKTTLMRILMAELNPSQGEATIGHNVSIGYFAQNQEAVLDPELTVLETIDNIAVGDIRLKIRDILAGFLFKAEYVDKKVAVLSGGERARLGMAKLMLQSYNLLALDEPTNHIDISAKELIKQALKAFQGTVIIVSHDRDFLDNLVDKIYEFRNGRVYEHLGGINDFLSHRRLENLKEIERNEVAKAAVKKESTEKVSNYQQNRTQKKELAKLKNKLAKLENEIETLEKKQKEIEQQLLQESDSKVILALSSEYEQNQNSLQEYNESWEALMLEIEG